MSSLKKLEKRAKKLAKLAAKHGLTALPYQSIDAARRRATDDARRSDWMGRWWGQVLCEAATRTREP